MSESGIQTQKSTKSKSADDSDNNSSSNDEADNASIGMNARDGSDNGSGTQVCFSVVPLPFGPLDSCFLFIV